MNPTPETFATLYYAASDAVKQRLADVAFGMRIAQENNNGPVYGNHQSDPDIPRDREVTPTKGDPQ